MFEATGGVHTPPLGRPNLDMLPGYSVGPTDPDRHARAIEERFGIAPPVIGNVIPLPYPPYHPDPYQLNDVPITWTATTVADKKIETAKKKPPLALVPQGALTGLARVFQYGAEKYAPGNFIEATIEDGAGERYISAALRHLAQMQHQSGLHTEESLACLDDESWLPHLDHAIASLVMLRAIAIKDGLLPADPKGDK